METKPRGRTAELGVKLDAVKALEERMDFQQRVIEDVEKTRARLFSELPAFQVNMDAPKFVPGEIRHAGPEIAKVGKIDTKTGINAKALDAAGISFMKKRRE